MMKIPDCINDYISYLKAKNSSPETIRTYIGYVTIFVRYLKERNIEPDIEDISRKVIDEYQIALSTKNNHTKMYLTAKAQQTRLCAIKVFFDFLHRKGYIDTNPTSHIELPKIQRKPPSNYLTYKETLKVLKEANGDGILDIRDKAILELLYSVGIRNKELCTLRLTDIDFTNQLIKINGKGGKTRIIPIGNVALDYIGEYLQKSRPLLTRPHKPTDILFLSRKNQLLGNGALLTIVKKYRIKAGITKRITPHTFRHSFATHLMLRGIDLRSLQELLGHNCITSTQIYTHLNLKDLKKIYSKTHPRENDLV